MRYCRRTCGVSLSTLDIADTPFPYESVLNFDILDASAN